jgi:hypothetical protein
LIDLSQQTTIDTDIHSLGSFARRQKRDHGDNAAFQVI